MENGFKYDNKENYEEKMRDGERIEKYKNLLLNSFYEEVIFMLER